MDTNEGPFLRTGDLGFLSEKEHLYFTSRLKGKFHRKIKKKSKKINTYLFIFLWFFLIFQLFIDLIIINGVNYWPHDIENSVENSHPLLRKGCSAAFAKSLEENSGELSESLCIVAEVKRDSRVTLALEQEIKSAIQKSLFGTVSFSINPGKNFHIKFNLEINKVLIYYINYTSIFL